MAVVNISTKALPVTLLLLCFGRVANAISCLSCGEGGVDSLSKCSLIKECSDGQTCYVEKTLSLQTYTPLFNAGCRDVHECNLIKCSQNTFGSKTTVASPRGKRELVICTECCYNDTCNTKGCGGKFEASSGSGAGLLQCFQCKKQRQHNPICSTFSTCQSHETCAYQYRPGVDGLPFYDLLCMNNQLCDLLNQVAIANNEETTTHCCNDHLCNQSPYKRTNTSETIFQTLECPTDLAHTSTTPTPTTTTVPTTTTESTTTSTTTTTPIPTTSTPNPTTTTTPTPTSTTTEKPTTTTADSTTTSTTTSTTQKPMTTSTPKPSTTTTPKPTTTTTEKPTTTTTDSTTTSTTTSTTQKPMTTSTPKPTPTTTPKPTTTTTEKPTTTTTESTTTSTTTTTTPKPTTTPTTTQAPTTTSTPKPTTTTPKPTTTVANVTVPVSTTPLTCQICTGPLQICEQLHGPTTCTYPNNFCINHLVNQDNGARSVERKCGNIDTCIHEWYQGTSDNDRCTTFNPNFVQTLDFECTYCCTTDNCNDPVVPAKSTLFKN